jgi:hypothetical protein
MGVGRGIASCDRRKIAVSVSLKEQPKARVIEPSRHVAEAA